MIPEAWFVRLVKSLRKSLPAPRSAAVLRRSGMYTAHYVGTHRIPALFRGLLKILPARLSIPLLLAAFRRHAFTFAGSGQFHTKGPFPGVIVLSGCPTCRPEAGEATGTPSGAYYEAAFEGLLHLCTPQVRVREVACQSRHAAHCRFQISIDREAPNGLEGESACAFS
jgi:divinyl protochlorophyllide a 8-vinyl-reductase